MLLLILIGIVIASSLFFGSQIDAYQTAKDPRNLYSICAAEIGTRFRDFYRSFATVMGAQITISLINTILTAVFVLVIGLPHAALVIAVTFLCGLLPMLAILLAMRSSCFLRLLFR